MAFRLLQRSWLHSTNYRSLLLFYYFALFDHFQCHCTLLQRLVSVFTIWCICRELERSGHLNPDSEVDLFALHHVFHGILQREVQVFQSSWNNHGLRTEGNLTPLQLFIMGVNHDEEVPDLELTEVCTNLYPTTKCTHYYYLQYIYLSPSECWEGREGKG